MNDIAKRVFVVSPHPDDESIGCGGALRDHVEHGASVRVVFLTSGENGGHGRSQRETIRLREAEAKAAAKVLGLESVEFWREPDGAFRATTGLVSRLGGLIREWRPQIVYVPHGLEMHPDHRAACRLVRRAITEAFLRGRPPEVLEFEVWTPLTRIDHIVDVSRCMKVKLAAIRAYKSQCAVMRFDHALAGLNRYRGEMHSWPGGDYAEVFTIWSRNGHARSSRPSNGKTTTTQSKG
jgi:LmbE family N-acetylglucosaminyl deacetylase